MGIFDINHKNKCPLCGKGMDYIYGDMVCSECGYHASYSASSSNAQNSSSTVAGTTNSTASPSPKQTAASTPKITYTYTDSSTASPSSNSKKKSFSKVFLIIIIVFVVINVASSLLLAFIQNHANSSEESAESFGSSTEVESPVLPDSDTKEVTSSSTKNLSDNASGIVEAVGLIFGKDASEVTSEELASIGYLDLHYYNDNYKAVGYGIVTDDDIITGRVYPSDSNFYSIDFSIFPNLDTLYMEYGSIGSLEGLDQLYSLGTDLTPSELAEFIDPAQLEILTLTDLFFASTLSGIENYTNLSKLTLDADYVETLDPLTSLTNLRTLQIYDGNSISSFQSLYDMPQLESLYLDCSSLSDIGFVSNMPNLKTLIIWDSKLEKIDALKDCCDSLTCLDLSYNYELMDYQVVSQLTQLEDLSLCVSYSFDNPIALPQLGNMPNLTSLLLGNFDDLSELANAPGLQSLSIYDTYAHDFSALSSLKNLTSLELYNMSLEPSVFEPIMELTNLEYIALDESYIWGNVEGLLKLPNLKEFYMSGCTTGFDVTNLEPNTSLEILDISNSELRALKDGKWDYNDNSNVLALSEHTDIFKNYQNLRELYIENQNLDSVQFAASLPYLEILDITDNNVTDLTPLAILPNLEYILCYNNPITNDGGLGNKVSME